MPNRTIAIGDIHGCSLALHAIIKAIEPRPDMDEQPVSMLRWESLRETTPGPHDSGKMVIAGHTSQKSGEVLDLGHLKCIDTYCCGGGWLTALEVGSSQIWQANRDGVLRRA